MYVASVRTTRTNDDDDDDDDDDGVDVTSFSALDVVEICCFSTCTCLLLEHRMTSSTISGGVQKRG